MIFNPDVYTKNMEALEMKYPELAERVKSCRIVSYELVQMDGCMPNLRHGLLGRFWYEGRLDEYLTNQWKGLKCQDTKVPIFLGFGLGFEPMYYLSKFGESQKIQAAIIVERDIEVFTAAMKVNDISELINKPNIYLFVGIPADELYLLGRELFAKNIREALFCGTYYPVFSALPMEIDKDFYLKSLGKILESCWDNLHNFGNDPEDSLIGLENMLDNISEIASNPGINLLYDKFKNKPAIIVATGPSLKKNIHQLKGLENKALVISVDASLKMLLANGIKPHLVTSLEREHEVQQFFDNIPAEQSEDIYMAACPVIFNHVYKSYTGPKVMVYRMFDHFKWLGIDKGMLDIKLSSSHMAFSIAKALGCDPIILVGQDLAYGEDGETHATSVPFSSEGENEFMVEGNYAKEIRTNDGWHGFLKALEIDVSQYKGKVYNATAGGAFIRGTLIKDLETITNEDLIEDVNTLASIKEGLKTFDTSQIENDIKHIIPLFDKTIEDLEAIIELCVEGSKLSPDLSDEELHANRTKIHTQYHDTYQMFLMHVIQSLHLVYEMQYAIKKTNPSIWYSFVGDITAICLKSLIKARGRISDGQVSE